MPNHAGIVVSLQNDVKLRGTQREAGGWASAGTVQGVGWVAPAGGGLIFLPLIVIASYSEAEPD